MITTPTLLDDRLVMVADTFTSLIASEPYFLAPPAIPVLTERKGDINAMLAAALSKLGLAIAVVMPDGEASERKGESIVMRVRLVAQISELVLINQSQGVAYRPALAATMRVMEAIDRKPNGLDPVGVPHRSGVNEFRLPDDGPPFRLIPDARQVVYHVTAFTTVEF